MYLMKYKELYSKNGSLGISSGMKGEYRAILRGIDGREKLNTGWKPNTILDQGLSIARMQAGGITSYAAIGTSATAVDITQVGLQGSKLGSTKSGSTVSTTNSGAPNYERVFTRSWTWLTGDGTGTIAEVITMTGFGDAAADACVRFVLTAPIVKGAVDQLTIEHRMTIYPDIVDATGVIDISGVDYAYVMRHYNVDSFVSSGVGVYFLNDPDYHTLGNGSLNAITGARPTVTGRTKASSQVITTGGVLGTYYINAEAIWSIDQGTGDWNCGTVDNAWSFGLLQYSLAKVSDGTPLTKENTHELRLNIRLYPQRYVP